MKFEHMQKAFNAALDLGLIILISKNENETTWFHFSDGKNMGYIQFSRFNEYSMSIQYKPSKSCGTGASFIDRSFFNDSTDFKTLLLECLQYDPAPLTRGKHISWQSFQEFVENYWDLKNSTIYQNYSAYPACDYFIQNSKDVK